MSFQPNVNSITSTFYFTSPDNVFSGYYFVFGASDNRAATKTVVKFKSAAALGRPQAGSGRLILLQGRNELYPEGSQTFNFPTREIAFLSPGNGIRVDADETFTMNMPLYFATGSTTEKVGGGTWAVTAPKVTIYGTSATPTLTVSEGYLRADTARAFADVALTIGANGGLAAQYVPGSTTEAATNGLVVVDAAKFAIAGSTLNVKITTGGASMFKVNVPFLTVPSSLASMIDAKTISLTHDVADRTPELVKETVGESVRYSYKFVRCFALFVR